MWNTPIDQLPVNPSSAAWVGTIGNSSPLHPDFGSDPTNGMSYIMVPGTEPKLPVTFDYSGESDPGPYPVPLSAPIEGGSASNGDRHVLAIDTDNCVLYEMWSAYPQAASWTAGSGAVFNLKSDALRPAGWTSSDAAGLPVFPGLVKYDEVASGSINHALRFTVPQTQAAYIWPARHLASSLTGSQYPPMGARFRLRADFDISGFSPTNQVILKALKKYGMFIADNGTSWFFQGVTDPRWNDDDLHNLTKLTGADFEAVDESSLMVDANSGQAVQAAATTVTVSPSNASLQTGASQQFSATVSNSSTQTVIWSVNGVTGGNSTVGLITTGGIYTAPSAVPSGGSVTIQATSTATASAVGSATAAITAPKAAAPVLSGITPSSGTQGTQVTVTLSGSNFQSGAGVVVGGSGVSVTGVNVVGASQIQAVLAISSTASTGAHTVSVTTGAGASGALSFNVNAAASKPSAPTLNGISPSSATQGMQVTVTLTGSNFVSGAGVVVGGSGVSVAGVNVISASQIQAVLSISSSASTGAHSVSVTTSGGASGAVSFNVNAAATTTTSSAPTLTSMSTTTIRRGKTSQLILRGSNFTGGATVAVQGGIVGVSKTTLVNPSMLTVAIQTSSRTAPGTYSLTVTTAGGTSNPLTFTIQ